MSESLRVLALLASALLWAAVGVAWAGEAGLLARLRWSWRACPPLRRVFAALAVAVAVAYAGGKGEGAGGEGVRSKEKVVSEEFLSSVVAADETEQGEGNVHTYSLLPTTYSLSMSDRDVSRGYRLVSVGTGEAFDFSPPAGACVATNWALRGASADWIRLRPEGWAFPSGGEAATNLTVFAGGRVRFPSGRSLAPVAPVPLGLVPAANWGMLAARDRPSLFWHMVREDGSLVLTWRNALLRRRTDCPVSFQAELRPTGGFTFRYDLSRLASDDLLEGVWGEGARSKEEGAGGEGVRSKEKVVSEEFSSSVVTTDGTQQDVAHDTYSLLLTPSYLSPPPPLRVTSLTFASADEMRCDAARTDFEAALGGLDPHSCPPGSTNTVWEHWVYTGTTNAPFARPQSTERTAVLRIAVSGSGRGELLVGDRAVPLVGTGGALSTNRHESTRTGETGEVVSSKEEVVSDEFLSSAVAVGGTQQDVHHHTYSLSHHSLLPTPSSLSLSLSVPRGADMPLYLRADGTLTVSLSSDDFAFGVLPDPAARRLVGRVNFPLVRATEPCIHDYAARRTRVELPVGEGAEGLSCTWRGGDGVEVENRPPRAATVTGNFPARETAPVTYTLSHPDYLFGQGTYAQSARFCPKPPDTDPEEPDPPWYDGGGSGGGGHGEVRWCCHWGTCGGGCGCGCDCAAAGGGGPDPSDGDAFCEDCPEHSTPYADCAPLHAADYTNAVRNVPPLGGVLYIREPPLCERIRLDVPTERRNCCPCPDHWTNYVGVAYKSGLLRLVDADGRDFERTETSCDVLLSGVSPSAAVGDASVAFSRNGEIYQRYDKTVLGVAIRGDCGVDLAACNALDADFGLPMAVCTNLWDAPSARLVTNVRLPDGQVHLELADATGAFAVWCFDNGTSEWRRLLDSATAPVRDLPMSRWKALMRRASGGDSPELPVRVTASVPGSVRLVLRYWNVIGGRFLQDEASQRITAVKPPVLADYTRDGRIDVGDVDACLSGRPYRFWTNPSAGDCVGGEGGLVNLFPVSVDVSPFVRAWGGAAEVRLHACGALRYCVPAGVAAERASAVWTDDVRTRDGAALRDAALLRFPDGGLDVGGVPAGGVLALTAVGNVDGRESPELVVSLGGAEVFRQRLPVALRPVREMYRFLSVRGRCGDGRAVGVCAGDPPGLPDAETDGRHFVFVHGYNVGPDGAREWADAMFKRLLLAGSRSMFTAVTWFGDYARIWEGVPVVGGESLNYYRNVRHAFASAAPFRAAVEGLPGRKVLLAHSLGNMLVSSAIVDHGMTGYERYHMLNAAVPMEAYDREAQTDSMVDGAWRDVSPRHRASRWHGWFAAPDFRAGLTWKGRFGVIPRAENCYSETEDVLSNPTMGGIGDAWSAQELLKGTTVLYGTDLLLQGIAVEGGWGINVRHVANPLAYVPGVGLRADYFANYTREQSIATPLFTSFDDARMSSTNALDFADADLRAKMLGDAIPAESFAAGANALRWFGNYEYLQNADHGWTDEDEEPKWRHSDIKNVDYRYVQDFFRHIKEATE